MRTLAVACALVCLLAPLPALADDGITFEAEPPRDAPAPPAPKERDFHLDLGIATEFPISMGGYVGAELPGRLLLQVGAGVMPGPYASAIDGVLVGVGAYDSVVSGFVKNALSDSFVLRLSGGWRPFAGHGFEILGGYTLVTLGGAATAGDIVNAVLAEAGSAQRVSSAMGPTIPLGATMHNVHVTLGWRWLVADDRVVIRASLSYLQCLAASASVKLPEGQGQGTAMEIAINQDLNTFIEPYLTKYVKTPLVGLSAGYRF